MYLPLGNTSECQRNIPVWLQPVLVMLMVTCLIPEQFYSKKRTIAELIFLILLFQSVKLFFAESPVGVLFLFPEKRKVFSVMAERWCG
jgi:hypothetical protein